MSLTRGTVRQHTLRDLQVYGRRYGLEYRVPALSLQADVPVLRGVVQERVLGPGMQLVASDVEVLHRYESCSRTTSPLSIIVLLEGHAEVNLARETLALTPGMALSVRLDAYHGLQAAQPAGQRLRALTLGLDETRLNQLDERVSSEHDSRMRSWHLPPALRESLEQALAVPLANPAQGLLLEGLGLQLLAHGLFPGEPAKGISFSAPGERQRLERVRDTLRHDPAQSYCLEALAELAVMSPASLRRKFRATFGCSVFDYLRECRLSLACGYLHKGYSVQQAAHFSGYRHASNFATAFRRRFGYSPSSLSRIS